MKNKQKLVYILPKFDLSTDTHYFYLYDFIKQIAKELDLALLIEKSNSDISFFSDIKEIRVQKFDSGFLRILENFLSILIFRLKGYNNFYIHYSQISAFNSSVIARLSGAKVFYWNCGMMWLFGKKRLLALILKMISYLVTGVEDLKKGYAKNYAIAEGKIKIMPNWVDLKRFKSDNDIYSKYDLDKDKQYILFVHRLAKRKGAHYIASIARELADYDFLIAGDGPYKEQLQEEIKYLSNVKLLGKVANSDIPALMKVSYVFFMPSEEEGFPRVLLEAMAADLPYVAFDIGGVREISTKEQQDFIVYNDRSMIEGIRKLLQDKELHQRLQEANKKHVMNFDISKVVDIFVNIIRTYGR